MGKRPKILDAALGPIDAYVGARLRARRKFSGLSQKDLAKSVGVTFQQVQKYEAGTNRMGSSRLYQMSLALSVPVSYFFEDMPQQEEPQEIRGFAERNNVGISIKEQQENSKLLLRNETLELIRAYYHIRDPKQRHKVHELVRSLSDIASSEK